MRVGGRASRTQYQYTLQDADLDELRRWAPRVARALAQAARAAATSPPTSRPPGLQLDVDIDRDTAVAPRHHPADDRRHALRRLRPAPGRDDRSRSSTSTASCSRRSPSMQASPDALDEHLRAQRAGRRWCRCRAFARFRAGADAARGQPPGAVPVGRRSRSTSRPATSLGQAVDGRSSAAEREIGTARRASTPASRARRRRSARRCASEPLLIAGGAARRLHRARHALRELRPPDHDPVDAAVGGRRRAARAAALQAPTSASSRSSASSCSSAS